MKIRIALVLSLAFLFPIRADDTGLALLLNPSGVNSQVFAPTVDGAALDFTAPQILIHKVTPDAEFVSAVWRDSSGQLIYQRDVFFVKPDYTVVVDYLYNKGPHEVVRTFTFPAGTATADPKGAQIALDGGKTLRLQSIDTADATLNASTVTLTSKVTAPVPLAAVFVSWTGNNAPKVEYVKPANPMIVKLKITFADQSVDEIGLAWESRALHLNGTEFHGWAACSRHGPAGSRSIEIQ